MHNVLQCLPLALYIFKVKKKCIKYAVHKAGTEVFGSLCSYEQEAIELLNDLKDNIVSMPMSEKSKFRVVKIEVTWDED